MADTLLATAENDGLTPRQRRFVEEYIACLNGAEAARRAGFSVKSAQPQAAKLRRNPIVAAAIARALEERCGITKNFIVEELAKVARANMGDFVEWGPGGVIVKASADLSEDQKAAVSEVSQTVTEAGSSVRVKLHDKGAALERLGKVLGLFKDTAGPVNATQVIINLPDGADRVLYGTPEPKDAA